MYPSRSISRTIAPVLFTILCVSLAGADTSDSYDIVRNEVYGNCRVWTAVDMLTDEVLHHIECSEETAFDMTSIKVVFQQGKLSVMVSKGGMFILDDFVSIAYRIDKGPLIRGRWLWDGKTMFGSKADNDLAASALDKLATGTRVAIQVADERGNILLDGAAAAVEDFKARVQQ